MAALDPSVAAVRHAVRTALQDLAARRNFREVGPTRPAGRPDFTEVATRADAPLVLVASSGGPDSLALAAATAFVAPRQGWRAGLLTVDHGLQRGSRRQAEAVVDWALSSGLMPATVLTAEVAGQPGGPEAAARDARYAALAQAATTAGAAAVLLGHTRDDQAETVLLALARGAGPRGLAGMPARRRRRGVTWVRPLLGIDRADTRQACAALGLAPWDDPHNTDPAYARARVRGEVLPALVKALGERVVDNLARTARQLADDNAALDALATEALAAARTGPEALQVAPLSRQPVAVRTRVLHGWLRELGVPGSALSHRHVAAVDALVTDWHGQGPAYLPGGRRVARHDDRLVADPRPGWSNPAASGVMDE